MRSLLTRADNYPMTVNLVVSEDDKVLNVQSSITWYKRIVSVGYKWSREMITWKNPKKWFDDKRKSFHSTNTAHWVFVGVRFEAILPGLSFRKLFEQIGSWSFRHCCQKPWSQYLESFCTLVWYSWKYLHEENYPGDKMMTKSTEIMKNYEKLRKPWNITHKIEKR